MVERVRMCNVASRVVWRRVYAAGFALGRVRSDGKDCVERVYETPVSRPKLTVPTNFRKDIPVGMM